MSEEKNITLAPCPFCGGRNSYIKRWHTDKHECGLAHVFCGDCEIMDNLYESDQEAANAWNCRANDRKYNLLLDFVKRLAYGGREIEFRLMRMATIETIEARAILKSIGELR